MAARGGGALLLVRRTTVCRSATVVVDRAMLDVLHHTPRSGLVRTASKSVMMVMRMRTTRQLLLLAVTRSSELRVVKETVSTRSPGQTAKHSHRQTVRRR